MNKNKKGISKGVFSALTWGLDTVISGIILSMQPFAGHVSILFAPLVAVFLHDFLGAIWLLIYLTIKGEIKDLFKCFKKKESFYAIAAGILGGPIGMGGYYLAIKYIGPSYSAAISSVYPIMGAVLAAIILKEKLNKIGWMGLVFGVVGVVLLSMDGTGGSLSLLGIGFALMPVIGWGSESIISAIGMKDGELKPVQVLNIRLLASGITFGVIVLPIIHGYGLIANLVMVNPMTLALIVLVGLVGAVSLSAYYSAIKDIGPVKAMSINITYVIWAVIMGLFMSGNTMSFTKILFIGMIFAGSIFVIISKKDEKNVIEEIIIKAPAVLSFDIIKIKKNGERVMINKEIKLKKSLKKAEIKAARYNVKQEVKNENVLKKTYKNLDKEMMNLVFGR